MKKVLFAKYNRTRREEYQISTLIYEDETGRHVEKVALNPKALPHIYDFEQNYTRLAQYGTNIKYLMPHIYDKRAVFEYLNGVTLDNYLTDYLSNIKTLVKEIKKVISRIYYIPDEKLIDFHMTSDFIKVFGSINENPYKSLKIGNIDIIFDNIMLVNEDIYCLDYEWVFSFPIPIEFRIYRCLLYFYNKYSRYIATSAVSFFEMFGYNYEMQETFRSMEDHFQQYVQGDKRCYIYTNNYLKKNKTFEDLQKADEACLQLQLKDDHIKNLEKNIETWQHDMTLKDNHIKNLKNIISDQEKDINHLKQQIVLKDNHIGNITAVTDTEKHNMILKDNHIKNLENIISDQEKDINSLKQQIILKDNHIDNITAQIDIVKQDMVYKDNHISNLEDIISNKEHEIYKIKNLSSKNRLKSALLRMKK